MAQSAGVDAVADSERQMPLVGDFSAGEIVRRREHRFERDHRILVAMDEQDRRRLAPRVARFRFAELVRPDQHPE